MKYRSSILALVALSACVAGLAQTEAPPTREMALVSYVDVKPDMLTEWEDLQKSELNPALKKAGIPWRYAWRPAVFGDAYMRVSVTPIRNFAQFDGDGLLREHLGPEAANRLVNKMRKCVNGVRRVVLVRRQDLSLVSEDRQEPKMAVVHHISIVPGRDMDFARLIKSDVLPLVRKFGIKDFWVHQTVFGGDANQWVTVSLIDNFAKLDEGPPALKILGEEGAEKFSAKFSGIVDSSERIVTRYIKELSYTSTGAAGN